MALTTKDSAKSREFLQLLFSKRAIAGTQLGKEQYKGVNLIYDDPQSAVGAGLTDVSKGNLKNLPLEKNPRRQNDFTGAVVGDRFVLFANHPKVLREAINNVQATDLSLISSSQYQQALTQLPSKKLGMVFLNLPSVATWLGKQLQPQTYSSQIIALELNWQGLLAQTTLIAAPEQEIAPPSATLSEPVKALQYIPGTTSLAISGSDLSRLENSNLNQLWTQAAAVLSGSGDDAISRLVTQPTRALQASWGIDLPQDIFSWVQGEYALAMLPSADSSRPDWIFVAQKTDAAEQGISRLDAIAQQKGLSITPLAVGEQKIYAWTQLTTAPANTFGSERGSLALKAKVQGVHTTVENYEVFTTSVEAMDAALKDPKSSLVNNRQFQSGIDAIPRPNQGYVYLDWRGSQEILERQLPILKLLELAGKPFFNNLRSLTISSYGDTKALQGGIFFQ